ncbi:uncharacterized protein [Aphelocoma coerulescens]|uniref:uncharacterized protein n=1 Tax=Aphelocoma coerulescens TaxID=39617 RepID=UPI003604C001
METQAAFNEFLRFLEKQGIKEINLYKELVNPRSFKMKATETRAPKSTWRAVISTFSGVKTEKTVAAVAIETVESGSAGCSSSAKVSDVGLTEQRPETEAGFGVAWSFGLAARKIIKNTAARVSSLRELLNPAEPDVNSPTAGRVMAAEAQTPDPGGGARAGQRDIGSPGARPKAAAQPKAAEGDPPAPDCGTDGSSAAFTVSSPAMPKPAGATRKQPQMKEKYQQVMQKVIKKLTNLSILSIFQFVFTADVLCSKALHQYPTVVANPFTVPALGTNVDCNTAECPATTGTSHCYITDQRGAQQSGAMLQDPETRKHSQHQFLRDVMPLP